MKTHTFTCDRCGKVKRDVNCWWLVITGNGPNVSVWTWDDAFANDEGVRHCCGQACAIAEVNAFLQSATENQQQPVEAK